jgi:hypothetical protein
MSVASLAQRARLTEGQLYSAAITVAVALLLLTGLGDVHGVVGTALSQPPLLAAPQPTFPPVVIPTSAPVVRGLGAIPVLEPPVNEGLPLPTPAPVPTFGEPTAVPFPVPSPSPPAAACTAQPAMDAARLVLTTVNGPAGGRVPDKDIMGALGLVTGCDPADPAVIDAVCGLVGTGQTVASVFLWAYPTPVPQLTTQVLFQALAACGQVRQP